jgi:hypothetical protein
MATVAVCTWRPVRLISARQPCRKTPPRADRAGLRIVVRPPDATVTRTSLPVPLSSTRWSRLTRSPLPLSNHSFTSRCPFDLMRTPTAARPSTSDSPSAVRSIPLSFRKPSRSRSSAYFWPHFGDGLLPPLPKGIRKAMLALVDSGLE